MRWLKKQWKENTNFRHAVTVLLCVGLSAAGLPPAVSNALGGIVVAVQV